MADRVDFYFRQRVTEAELDLAFAQLEAADRNLAADLGIYGIVAGAHPAQRQPVPGLSIHLNAPARAYDRLGQRIFVGHSHSLDLTQDLAGIPTRVAKAGNERWLAVFLRFERLLSDPRTDGNAQQVYFKREESFAYVLRQGPEAPAGSAPKVALQADELLVCDIRLAFDQAQVLDTHIDLSRRQAFVFAKAQALAIDTDHWHTLLPQSPSVQHALDATDATLTRHCKGLDLRHLAQDIDFVPQAFIKSLHVQGALTELLNAMTATTVGASGAQHVGSAAVPGTPLALGPATVQHHLQQILRGLNQHLSAASAAHQASAIATQPHAHLKGKSVQAQLQELVASLLSHDEDGGASLIGNATMLGKPHTLSAGSLRQHLVALLAALNSHLRGGEHDARYYLRDEPVSEALTLEGQPAHAFAPVDHDHDERYLHRSYLDTLYFAPGETKAITTFHDRPALIALAYSHVNDGVPEATTFLNGVLTSQLRYWLTKVNRDGDKDYTLSVQNLSSYHLHVYITAYRMDG